MNSLMPSASPAMASSVPYAQPAYSGGYPAQSISNNFGAPIPLTPVVTSEDALGLNGGVDGKGAGGGGGGGKFFAILPPFLPLPIILPIVFVLVLAKIVAGLGVGAVPAVNRQRSYDYPAEEDHQETDNPASRRRRSTGKPVQLTSAQVDKLTQVVFSALKSQECVQRLLCEAGQLTRSFSSDDDGALSTVTKSFKAFVPDTFKESYAIFTKTDSKCEKYTCGSLHVDKK